MDKVARIRLLKALANENRLKLLEAIKNSQRGCACSPDSPAAVSQPEGTLCCVDEIVGQFDMAQSTISQHLKELHTAGILQRHKRAQWVYYTIDKGTVDSLVAYLQDLSAGLTESG